MYFVGNASSLADQKASAEVEESPYIKWARGLYEILASGVVTKLCKESPKPPALPK